MQISILEQLAIRNAPINARVFHDDVMWIGTSRFQDEAGKHEDNQLF